MRLGVRQGFIKPWPRRRGPSGVIGGGESSTVRSRPAAAGRRAFVRVAAVAAATMFGLPSTVYPSADASRARAVIVPVGRLPAAAPALDIAVAGTTAYVAAHARGVHVVDIAQPSAPLVVGTVATAGPALAVDADGRHLAVAVGAAGVMVFDLVAGGLPTPAGTVPPTPDGRAYSVLLDGDILWVGEWNEDYEHGDPDHGLRAIDLAAPGGPSAIGARTTPGWAVDIAIDGDVLALADGPGGLRLFDVHDPTSPRPLGSLPAEVRAYGVALEAASHRAFVADNTAGLLVADLSDPMAPAAVGRVPTAGAVYDVAAAGEGVVWLAQADGGGPADGGRVTLVHVGGPAGPFVADEVRVAQRAWGAALDGAGHAWIAATGAGVIGLGAALGDPGPAPTATPPTTVQAGRVWLPWLAR